MNHLKRRLTLLLTLGLLLAALLLSAWTFGPLPASGNRGDTVHCIHLYGLPWRTVGTPPPAMHWVRHGHFCVREPVK